MQNLHSFMTSRACVMPTQTQQGARNSGAIFQSRVEPCFTVIRHELKAWLDDFAIQASTEDELLNALKTFLSICRKKNLKVSLKKSTFFDKELRWCGRIVGGDGVRLDPRRLSGLTNVLKSKTAAELCDYVHCLTWMSIALPDFSQQVAPLRALLEEAYTRSGARTKKSIRKLTKNHSQRYRNCYKLPSSWLTETLSTHSACTRTPVTAIGRVLSPNVKRKN